MAPVAGVTPVCNGVTDAGWSLGCRFRRGGVSSPWAAARARSSLLRHLPPLSPKPQTNNGFGHPSKVRANRRRRRTCDSSNENGALNHA